MQLDKRDIGDALKKKGFIHEDAHHHHYYYHEYKGKRTGIKTYTSHGSSLKVYGDSLLKLMRRQLRLDTVSQLADLVRCPMSESDYTAILKEKGLLPEPSPSTSASKSRKKKGGRRRRRGA